LILILPTVKSTIVQLLTIVNTQADKIEVIHAAEETNKSERNTHQHAEIKHTKLNIAKGWKMVAIATFQRFKISKSFGTNSQVVEIFSHFQSAILHFRT
jgi:hypothetical protein